MDIVKSIISPIVGPVWSEIGYIISYKGNIDNLTIELQHLEAAKQTLQLRIDAAQHNGDEKLFLFNFYRARADLIIAEAKKDEEHARFGCLNWPFQNLCAMYQQSRKAKENINKISGILKHIIDAIKMPEIPTQVNKAITMPTVSSQSQLQVAFPRSTRCYLALLSRTKILNAIMQKFEDDNIYMIGLYGMAGVGKSMLIEEIAWQAEHSDSYGTVIMVNVTSSPDVKRIQGQLADGLSLKFTEESKEGRARELFDRIRKEKKILVIMDDLWGKIDLYEAGVPFGDQHKGCKLLLTSRNLKVLNGEMNTQKYFRLEPLSQEESWNLFEKTAGNVVKHYNIQTIAMEVAKACMGLPLLLVTVAKSLKSPEELYCWKEFFIALTKYEDK